MFFNKFLRVKKKIFSWGAGKDPWGSAADSVSTACVVIFRHCMMSLLLFLVVHHSRYG